MPPALPLNDQRREYTNMLGLFIAQVLNGLLDGTYYLLIALGLSLIFSLGGIINLAHGAFFAIGAYLAILITPFVGFFGALILVPLIVAGLGILTERLLFTRFYRASPQNYNIPDILRGQVFFGDFIYSRYRLFLIAVAVVAVAGLWVLLNRTSFGRIVRAGVQNPDILGSLGISLRPYLSMVAGIGIGLAGLAGVLLAPIHTVHPAMGAEIITLAFVVVVIGGLGSFWGVILAAILVGLTKGVLVAVGLSVWSTSAIYLLMFVVLLVRPRGLLGERILRFE
jgi:branched-chain amino acid transport system permease protein